MSFDLDSSLKVLARTPAMLDALFSRLNERWIRYEESPNNPRSTSRR